MDETQQRGQSLVEFTLVLGIMLMLLFVMISILRLYNLQSLVDKVAQEGSRYAAEAGGGTEDVLAYMNTQYELFGGDRKTMTVTVTAVEYDVGSETFVPVSPLSHLCGYGDHVAVTVSADYRETIPAIGLFTAYLDEAGAISATHLRRCWRGG